MPDRLVAAVAATVTGAEVAVVLGVGWAAVSMVVGVPGGPTAGFAALVAAGLLLVVAGGLAALAVTPGRPAQPAGALLGLAAGAIAGLILIRLDDLVELFVPTRGALPASRTSTSSTRS